MRRIGRLIHFFARFAAAGRKFGYVFLNTGGVKNGDPAVAVYVGKLLLQVGKADKVDRRLLDQRRVVYGHIAVAVNIAEYRSVVKGVDLAADILQIIKTGIIDRFISCVIGNTL